MRGENPGFFRGGLLVYGTSPRARGKRSAGTVTEEPLRNIPACAGKTHLVHEADFLQKEHPRVRGENTPPPPTGV